MNMIVILADASFQRRFLDIYSDWRRAAGDSMFTLPVAGPNKADTVLFAQVPTEFLPVLETHAIAFRFFEESPGKPAACRSCPAPE
jgi:hypothetical protein